MSEDTSEQPDAGDTPADPGTETDEVSGEAGPATPGAGRRAALIAAIALVWVAAATAFAFGPAPVTVDGAVAWVPHGTTVADLTREGRLTGAPGDLLSVKGGLLKRAAGAPAIVSVDGRPATAATVLKPLSHVSSADGADAVESVVTATVETTPLVLLVGTGPVETVEETGAPKVVEVATGAVSGEVVSRRVVSRGYDMTVRREPAWPGRKEVALTFDDGPWPTTTDAMLAQLTSAKVKATFFMLGRQLIVRPETAKRVLAAGMEIGDHSYSHKLLANASRREITSEIARGADAIRSVLGFRPMWYRPAGGSTNSFVYHESRRLGMRIVLWTIDPHDYRRPGATTIVHRVLDNVRPGSVILMHDGGGDRTQTVEAVGRIIKGLKARGYSMVTLSRLYRRPTPKP